MILDFLLDALPGAPGTPPGNALGHVLHVGPGRAAGLAWQGRGWTGLTLVEADPEAAEALCTAYEGDARVRVVAGAATASGTGTGRLQRYGFGELDALRAPTGARLLFPGLARRDAVEVPLIDPVALVRGLEPGEGAHLLVLDAPGEGQGILAALAAAGGLAPFVRIVVREGREALYEGAGTLDEIEAMLREAGHVVTGRDADDPDRPWIRTGRDPRLAEIERLTAALAAAEARCAALAAERDKLAETVAAERANLVKERDSATAQSTALGKTTEDLKERLESERQARNGRLALMREELLKAEGQIDFIAELLLDGSRL